jgi:hypothetical protein
MGFHLPAATLTASRAARLAAVHSTGQIPDSVLSVVGMGIPPGGKEGPEKYPGRCQAERIVEAEAAEMAQHQSPKTGGPLQVCRGPEGFFVGQQAYQWLERFQYISFLNCQTPLRRDKIPTYTTRHPECKPKMTAWSHVGRGAVADRDGDYF